MKITTSQYYEIEEQLSWENGLVEPDLLREMADHSALSIQDQMEAGQDFEGALQTTIVNLGGVKGMRQIQWSYRKQAFRLAFGALMANSKKYWTGEKLNWTIIVILISTGLGYYVSNYSQHIAGKFESFLPGTIFGFGGPLIALVLFLICQPFWKWTRVFPAFNVKEMASPVLRSIVILLLILLPKTVLMIGLAPWFNFLILTSIFSLLGVILLAGINLGWQSQLEEWYQTR